MTFNPFCFRLVSCICSLNWNVCVLWYVLHFHQAQFYPWVFETDACVRLRFSFLVSFSGIFAIFTMFFKILFILCLPNGPVKTIVHNFLGLLCWSQQQDRRDQLICKNIQTSNTTFFKRFHGATSLISRCLRSTAMAASHILCIFTRSCLCLLFAKVNIF